MSGLVATSVVVGLLPLARGPLGPILAGAASDHLVFTTQPGDGDPNSALAAQPVVTIEDSSNATVDTSSTIALTLTGPGGATLSGLLPVLTCDQASNSMSASHGVAAFTGCKVNRGGIYTLTATDSADGNITVVSSNFFVSGPAQLAFTAQPSGGTAGTAWTVQQPQVTVEDAHGTAVGTSTASIGLAIVGGTGTSGATLTCTTDPLAATAGVATFSGCKIDKVGTGYELVATDATDSLISPSSNSFPIAAGSPAKVVFTAQPSSSAFGGTAFGTQPAVAVEDAGNNVIAGNADHIQLSIKSGSGTAGAALTCTTDPATASNGAVSFAGCKIDKAGSGYKLTATDTDASLSADSNNVNVQVGSPSQISFSPQPGGGAPAAPFGTQPAVHVTDAGGNPVAGSVDLTITGGTGTAGAVLSCTTNPLSLDSTGTASFAGCQIDRSGSNYQLHASSGSIGVDSSAFNVNGTGPAANASFAGHQPGNGTGGSALSAQPQVTLTDGGGNPASGAVTLTITDGTGAPGAVLSCDSNPVNTNGSGVAVFTGCAIDKIGSGYTLTATSGAASATSDPFDVTVGAAAQLAFVQQPSGGGGGQVWATQPIVQVQDAGGNQTTSNATVSLSVTSGSGPGALSCTSASLPAVNGSAQFSGCSIDKVGSAYTLTAHASGLSDGVSNSFAITVGAPAKLVFSNQPGGGGAGLVWAAQPSVTVADAGGNTVTTSGASISLAMAAGSGTGGAALSCDSNPLGASGGVASFTGCSIDKAAGGYSLIATDSADSLSAESLPFSILLPPPGPLGLAPTGVPVAQTFGSRVYGVNPTNTVDDVNTATGSLSFAVNDLNVAGIGEPLSLVRTYNSADTGTPSIFGQGWTSLLDIGVVVVKNSTATVRGEDGQQLVWTFNAVTSTWVAPPGAQGSLQCGAKACSFTRNDGVTWDVNLTPNGQGEIQDYLNPDGQGLHFSWGAGSVAISIANTTGKAYNVVATLGGGHVLGVTTPNQGVPGSHRTVLYGYTGGLLTSVNDAAGHTWTYTYDGSGRLLTMTDPLLHQRLVAGYDGSGRVNRLQLKGSPQHADDTFSWDPGTGTATRGALANAGGTNIRENSTDQYIGNVLVQQTTAWGGISRFSYDAHVNLVEAQDPQGWVTQYAYDANDNLISQTTPITATQSATTSFTYDPSHRLLTQTDADGNTVQYVYNGPVLGFIRPPNITPGTAYVYNKQDELVEVDGPLGNVLYQYDAFGNRTVVLQQTLGGAPLNGKGTRTAYDEAGDILSTTDPRGTTSGSPAAYTTTRTYDATGRLLSTTTPGPQTSSTAYNAAGDVVSTTDSAGHTATYAWDESTLTRTTTANGHSSTQVYDPSGNLLTENNPGNRTTTHVFDGAGREISTTDPSNVTTSYVYDVEGNVVAVSDNTGQTLTRDFDSRNRVIRQVNDGAVSLTGYDPAGRVVSTTAPSGSVTTTTYDAYGNVTSVQDANGTTSYSYDGDNNLLARTDPNGHVTTYTYNGADQQTSMTTAGATTSYAYDVAGNLTRITDADGRATAYTLNALNQPVTTVYSKGTQSLTVNQTFDALGRRTGMSGNGDATGPHSYSYDGNGNMTSVQSAQGTFSYDYTSTPGQIKETYPDGTHVTYSTDDAGNLMSVASGSVSAGYVRNAQRQTVGIAYGNGVYQSQRTDVLGDVLHQTLTLGATTLADKSYSYDAGQNRLSYVDDVLGTVTTDNYNYSTTGRLTAFSTSSGVSTHTTATAPPPLGAPTSTTGGTAPFAGTGNAAPFTPSSSTPLTPTYSYDPNGNMLSGNGLNTTYGSADQITGQSGSGAAPYTYDNAGNVTARGGTGFVYDAAGHLVSASTPSGTVTYTYDGDGNRVSRTLNGSTTKYVWDSAGAVPLLAIEQDGSSHLIRRFINGEGPVAMQTSSATYYMHLDPQGTVTELTDGSGAVVAAYHYDGYGNLLSTDGGTPPANDLLFQGQLYDSATGLYYMRARDYDPSTGRFTRRDPVTPATGTPAVSPYAFVADMPTLLTDATGMVALPTATSIFWGKSSLGANIGTDIKYGFTAVKLGVKIAVKATAYLASRAASKVASIIDRISSSMGSIAPEATQIAEEAGNAELHAASAELETAGETAAKFGKAAKFLGPALDVIGIGLQTFITVEDCMHGPVATCVGDALGLAINIGFTVGCAVATEGTATAVCAIAGAIIGLAVQEIVTRYGPVIADFAVSVYKDAAAGIEAALPVVTNAVVHYYNVVAGGINTALGAIATGINKATAAISSGFITAVQTLVDAGYTAVQLGTVLKNVFNEGLLDTVAALVNFGYQIADIANLVKNVFNATAQEAAQLFKNAFNYTVTQIAGILKDVYNLADEAAATILKAINFAVDEVGTALKTIYNDAAAAVGQVLKDIGYVAQQIGAVLQHVFSEIDSAVAAALKTLGYAVDVVATALRNLYNDIDSAVAAALQIATFVVNDIATALKDVFHDVGQVAAQILKNLTYTIDEIAGALKNVFSLVDQAAAQILENIQFAVNAVATALKDVFNDIDTVVATVLRNIGNTVIQIATALNVVFSEAAQVAANVLKAVGFVINDIATALNVVFSEAAQAAANILKAIGFLASEVAGALLDVFSEAAQAAAQILKNIGYAIDEITSALQTVFGEAAEAAAQILKAIGYTATEIANALVDIFNELASDVGQILKDIGEAAADIANVLENVFNEATSDIANFLSSIGFDSSTIDAIGGAFASFGQSVANCFTSLFSDC